MSEPILQVVGLRKSFQRGRTALDDVSFSVNRGDIFGLLGHNGAGKSTALGIMLGLVYPDAGEVLVDGTSVQRQRSEAMGKVGAIFESPSFYDYLSGWRNLRIITGYSGPWDESAAREVVDLVGLRGRVGDPVRTYSHGMRQRLALAQALLPSPKVLLLDEPTDGLDPEGIREFRELVLRLRDERGLTVLLNSHLLAEVEQMCGRFAILRQGRLVYQGDGCDIGSRRNEWVLRTGDPSGAQGILHALGAHPGGGPDRWVLPDGTSSEEVIRRLVAGGIGVREATPFRRTLEELYLEVSGGRDGERDGGPGKPRAEGGAA